MNVGLNEQNTPEDQNIPDLRINIKHEYLTFWCLGVFCTQQSINLGARRGILYRIID